MAFEWRLENKPRTLRDMKVGDKLILSGGYEVIILDTRENIFCYQYPRGGEIYWLTFNDADKRGYYLKDEPILPSKEEQDKAIEVLKAAGRIKEGKILE